MCTYTSRQLVSPVVKMPVGCPCSATQGLCSVSGLLLTQALSECQPWEAAMMPPVTEFLKSMLEPELLALAQHSLGYWGLWKMSQCLSSLSLSFQVPFSPLK